MIILQTIYFFLPAGFANMAPVFVQRINFLAGPLDMGKTIGGVRIFGDNKTVRGLVAGILLGVGIAYLQSFHLIPQLEITDYDNWLALGFLQSFGALLGDAIKSFFKRRTGIAPGQSWFPYDQIDFVIGAIALTSLYMAIPRSIILTALILAPVFHLGVNKAGYLLGIRNVPR